MAVNIAMNVIEHVFTQPGGNTVPRLLSYSKDDKVRVKS